MKTLKTSPERLAYLAKYREANREKCRDAERKYRKNNKEKVNAKKRERYYSKPEELKAKAAQYRQENYKRRLEIERNSRVKNKEKYRPAKNARQRIRNKVIQGGTYLILDKELRKIYNSPCFRCGSMKDQSLDHIIPISRGGSHSIGNIMTLCLPCNMSKNVKLLVEWRNQN